VILFRPTGPRELALIEQSGFRTFPPRLPDQPIFYPVMNFPYAEQIARDWNSKREDTGFRGYVLQFEVDDDFAARYEPQTVGASMHRELWVPAEELDAFNARIIGLIEVVATYERGERTS
jgi:hypothetical protein